MILVTVGSAPHPFNRLVQAVDRLALEWGQEVVVQAGFTSSRVQNCRVFNFVPYEQMIELYKKADLVISHASAGPIIFSNQFNKPLILFPRSGDRGEHVDNHQVDFAMALEKQGSRFEIVYSESELKNAVERALAGKGARGGGLAHHEVGKRIETYLNTIETRKMRNSKRSFLRRIKEMLYYLRIYRLLSSFWNHTFWMLRGGYEPKKFWTQWSRSYIRQKARGKIGPSHEWILKKIKLSGAKRILEAGCGYGNTLKFLRQRLSEEVFLAGVDVSFPMLRHFSEENSGGHDIQMVCADVNRLPFASGAVDFLFTRGALMHCPEENLEAVLSEFERVSKGEILLVEETFWDSNASRGASFNLNPYTFIHDYEQILAKQGWELVEKLSMDEGMVLLTCLHCRKSNPKGLEVNIPGRKS